MEAFRYKQLDLRRYAFFKSFMRTATPHSATKLKFESDAISIRIRKRAFSDLFPDSLRVIGERWNGKPYNICRSKCTYEMKGRKHPKLRISSIIQSLFNQMVFTPCILIQYDIRHQREILDGIRGIVSLYKLMAFELIIPVGIWFSFPSIR